jgi:formylglycine-generating enzyme required for sulfatase activity
MDVGSPTDAGVVYETGWVTSDNSNIAPTDDHLACNRGCAETWTASPSSKENLPIDCVNWYEAYAFCIWDGGFLPSEAEWQYAAAGGIQQRRYPWGSTEPGTANQYAIYNYYYPSGDGGIANFMGVSNIAPVGTAMLGVGLWGQLDLYGNMWQWVLDWSATYVNPCTDCGYVTGSFGRILRGGGFDNDGSLLLPPNRSYMDPAFRAHQNSFRCARTP